MIPLLSISQKRYIIEGDTIVGFNNKEVRNIALIFIEGEKYEELYFNSEEILKYKDSVITTQYNYIEFLDSTLVITHKTLDELNKDYIESYNELQVSNDKIRKRNNWLTGSIIGNIVLILILLL